MSRIVCRKSSRQYVMILLITTAVMTTFPVILAIPADYALAIFGLQVDHTTWEMVLFPAEWKPKIKLLYFLYLNSSNIILQHAYLEK